jgi:hypothetical protein
MIKNSLEILTVNKTELKKIESLLLKTNYELYEIWTPDADNEVQVWSNKKLKKNIQVTITEDDPIEDNTTKVINELVDLWLELRAIRNAVEYNDDDLLIKMILSQQLMKNLNQNLKKWS